MKNLLLTLSVLLALTVVGAESITNAPPTSHPVAGRPVRNPFWPIGYEGRRETISAEVRDVPKKKDASTAENKVVKKEDPVAAAAEAAAAEARRLAAEAARKAAEARARIITEKHWTDARRALRIGGRLKVEETDGSQTSCAMINGNAYVDGDLVSFNHGPNRFTWRVTGLSDTNTLMLARVKARRLDEIDKTAGGHGKGATAKGEKK